jgi:transcriptional regulator with XRE-family HTH domain
MSQKELGLALGLSQTQISARLRGEVAISLDEIELLADILGTSTETLLTGALTNDERPQPTRAEASPSLPRLDLNQQPAGCALSLIRGGAPVARSAWDGQIARSAPRSTRGLTPHLFTPSFDLSGVIAG